MRRRTACTLLTAGVVNRLLAQANAWDEETRLGVDALEQGHRDQAEQHLQKALDLANAAKADDLDIARCLDNLALSLALQKREKLYRQALAIREKRLTPDDTEIARSLALLGSALGRLVDQKSAQPLLDRALKIAEADSMTAAAADTFVLIGLMRNAFRSSSGDILPNSLENLRANVRPLYQRALEIREQNRGPDDLALAKALELNGAIAGRTDGAGAAQTFVMRAAEIRKRHIQKLSRDLVITPVSVTNPAAPPSPELTSGVYKIGGGVSPPTVINKIEPEYSDLARLARWQGEVTLSVVVTTTGSVGPVRLLRSLGMGLDEQAYFAVRDWKFRPGMREGQPVNIAANIAVTFRLL